MSCLRAMLPLLAAALLLAPLSGATDAAAFLPVHGRIVVPDAATLATAEVLLQLDSGRRLKAFPLPDGAFAFAEVPVGVHTLTVEHRSLLFPALRLDVGAGRRGKVSATAADVPGNPALPHPLLIRPLAGMEYFERRVPFSILAWLKTPYGMMAGFMAFSMFIMPKLKVDPEELKEMQQERAVGGGGAARPAISGGGGGRRRDD